MTEVRNDGLTLSTCEGVTTAGPERAIGIFGAQVEEDVIGRVCLRVLAREPNIPRKVIAERHWAQERKTVGVILDDIIRDIVDSVAGEIGAHALALVAWVQGDFIRRRTRSFCERFGKCAR
jgi:hypothetical protein